MMKLFSLSVLALLSTHYSFGQGNSPAKWIFTTGPISRDEIVFTAKVHMASSWHLYSQHIQEGGPQPTRFIFEDSPDYVRMGKTEEQGKPTTFYDDIYEMDITWFSEEVSFRQRIRLNRPVTVIKGKVEYMVCNNAICVPRTQAFAVDVGPVTKNP